MVIAASPEPKHLGLWHYNDVIIIIIIVIIISLLFLDLGRYIPGVYLLLLLFTITVYYYFFFFTLGIKDPEGFGKKLEENVSE